MKTFAALLEQNADLPDISDADIDAMVESLTWDDIADLYSPDELIEVDELEEAIAEAISAQSRLKKRMTFARHKAKRVQLKGIKLQIGRAHV